MVIIDKEYITKIFKQALWEQGFDSTKIRSEESAPHVRVIKFEGRAVFSLYMEVSLVSEVPPTVNVVTESGSLNMIAICERVDELLQKRVKIFLN